MKALFATLLMCASALAAQAQIATVSTPEPLLRGVQSNLYNPILSADGTKLMFSNADYSNLRMYDFDLGATVNVCDEPRAGYSATFSPDGRSITLVTRTRTDINAPASMNVKRYDIANAALLSLPAEQPRNVAAIAAASTTSVRTAGDALYINVNGREKSFSPVEAVAYLWASLSPDGSKVMFVAAGKGIYVTDLEGNILDRKSVV